MFFVLIYQLDEEQQYTSWLDQQDQRQNNYVPV